jgi:hypothetical protein
MKFWCEFAARCAGRRHKDDVPQTTDKLWRDLSQHAEQVGTDGWCVDGGCGLWRELVEPQRKKTKLPRKKEDHEREQRKPCARQNDCDRFKRHVPPAW